MNDSEHDDETDGHWFAGCFEDSRFGQLWQFRLAGAVKALFVGAIFALMAVVLYRFAASGGLLEPLLLYQNDPPQSVPPEFESMPETAKNGVLFIQFIWFLITELMRAGGHLILLAATTVCALAAGVSVLFAVFELELAYKKPIDTERALKD